VNENSQTEPVPDLLPALKGNVATVKVLVAGAKVSVASATFSVAGAQVSVAAVKVSVAGVRASIAEAKASIAAVKVSIAAAKVSIAAAEVSIAEVKVPVAAVNISILLSKIAKPQLPNVPIVRATAKILASPIRTVLKSRPSDRAWPGGTQSSVEAGAFGATQDFQSSGPTLTISCDREVKPL